MMKLFLLVAGTIVFSAELAAQFLLLLLLTFSPFWLLFKYFTEVVHSWLSSPTRFQQFCWVCIFRVYTGLGSGSEPLTPTRFEHSVIPTTWSQYAWQTPRRKKARQACSRGPFWGLERSIDLDWKIQHPWRGEHFYVWSSNQHDLAILLQQSTWWERGYSVFIWHQCRVRGTSRQYLRSYENTARQAVLLSLSLYTWWTVEGMLTHSSCSQKAWIQCCLLEWEVLLLGRKPKQGGGESSSKQNSRYAWRKKRVEVKTETLQSYGWKILH